MLAYLHCHTLQPARLVVLVEEGGLRILAERVGGRGVEVAKERKRSKRRLHPDLEKVP